MRLLNRLTDILSANLNELVERYEDQELLLKQVVREIDASIRVALSRPLLKRDAMRIFRVDVIREDGLFAGLPVEDADLADVPRGVASRRSTRRGGHPGFRDSTGNRHAWCAAPPLADKGETLTLRQGATGSSAWATPANAVSESTREAMNDAARNERRVRLRGIGSGILKR